MVLYFSCGAQSILTTGYRVYPWVQRILTTVNVFAQGILNEILFRVLSLVGLGYIYAPVVSYPCGGKIVDYSSYDRVQYLRNQIACLRFCR